MRRTRFAASLLTATALIAACRADESLRPPTAPPTPSGGALFQRYVSMGNSITAGFQSAGINDSTQRRSYAVLLAAAMGAEFTYPSLLGRGCPPPFTNNVTQARLGGGTPTTCDLRASNTVPGNLAVPGARVEELLNNFGVPVSSSNALTLLFLGGQTQVERLLETGATYVSVWIGNNDVLGSLTSQTNPGNPLLVTPLPVFQQEYDSVADAIDSTGADALLIGVADVSVIPYASTGATYWCIKNQPACGTFPAAFPPTFTVSNNCAPALAVPGAKGDSTLVPWPIWIPRLKAALPPPAGTLTPANLDCTVDADVVTAAEYANLRNAVLAFNTYIQSVASTHNWAFWNPNSTLLAEVQTQSNPTGRIPAFPDLSQALTGGSVLFGPLFTLDGVHPSSLTHRIVADSAAFTINAKYTSTLPVPICSVSGGPVACPRIEGDP
ncbi:MAG TPA: SGNH/GDSL hydrolase family protein [Gemmatimonadales bacterium]